MLLAKDEKAGRIRVMVFGKSYRGDWKVAGQNVIITSTLGEGSARLGGLASAPAAVASEKLTEMAKAATKPQRATNTERARFDVKDAFRRR